MDPFKVAKQLSAIDTSEMISTYLSTCEPSKGWEVHMPLAKFRETFKTMRIEFRPSDIYNLRFSHTIGNVMFFCLYNSEKITDIMENLIGDENDDVD
mgnify:CR=1 FL=1